MRHPIHRVQSVDFAGNYTLRVRFDDGIEQTIDFEPVRAGEPYESLRNAALFRRVRINLQAHTLLWPNGADFDPAMLHDWPQYVQELTARAKRWRRNAP